MALGVSNCVVCGSEIATCLIMQLEVCQKCGFDLLAPSGEDSTNVKQDTRKDDTGVV